MKLKKIFVAILCMGLMTVGGVTPVMAADPICDATSGFSAEQKEAAGCNANKTVGEVANSVIEVVIGLVGLLAVGIILYGGISYTTSTGDAAKVAKAKRVIMYGIVGLVVALLAFTIVRFVPKIVG